MSGTRISDLPAITTPAMGDIFPVVQAGVTYKESMTQLSTLFVPLAGGTMTGNLAFSDNTAIQSGANPSDSMFIQAYDNNDAAYKTFCTITSNNTPSLEFSRPSGATMIWLGGNVRLLSGLSIQDASGNELFFSSTEVSTTTRIIKFDTNDGDVNFNLTGTDITLADWFNQSVKSTASPTFASVSLTTGTISSAPSAATDIVNKAYADAIVAGLTFQAACVCATTAALTATYANGAAGVGATLTNSGALAAFSTDGVSPTVGQRVLVKNQASSLQNGIYTVTTVGSGAVAWVLTRATDFDQPSEIIPGDLAPVTSGTVNNNTTWLQTATVATVGTDAITFSQFSYAAATTNTANTTALRDGSGNFAMGALTATGVNVSGLTASQAVVTDGSKNLASLAYTTTATASALVQRDGFGDIAVGDIDCENIISTGSVLRFNSVAGLIEPGTTAGDLIYYTAYDVNDTTYRIFGTATSNNTPTFAWSQPAGGTLTWDGGAIGASLPATGKFTTLTETTTMVNSRTATAASANATTTITGVTSNAAARTITLLSADALVAGTIRIIKDEAGTAASANNITIDTQGAELIDGAASVTITANYGVVRVYSNGTNWFTF